MMRIKRISGFITTVALIVVTLGMTFIGSNQAFAVEPCVDDGSGGADCTLKPGGGTDTYGRYKVKVHGNGINPEADWDNDAVTFYYYPAYAELVKENGKYYLDLRYNGDNGAEDPTTTGEVASMVIKVYYPTSGGEEEAIEVPFSPITVLPNPSNYSRVELPFEEYGLDPGAYKVEVYAFNRYEQQLSAPYTFIANYEIEEDTDVPNTGGLFQNTNISKTDYLITGLVIFGLVAVAGTVFIIRNDKRKSSRKSGRRR